MILRFPTVLSAWLLLIAAGSADALAAPPDATATKAADTVLLNLPTTGTDPAAIDYAKLPVIEGTHAVVNLADPVLKFQLHSYLAHHNGRYWCMWSQGPPVEDEPSQLIRYATSEDGLKWSDSRVLVGPPKEGYGYIARGFWVRDGELLALFAHFKGKGAFGVDKELRLEASAWDQQAEAWSPKGLVYENAINNFPPQKLPTGEWMMTRRDSRFNVSVLIGGSTFDAWKSFPVVERRQVEGFSPDEPIWWDQPNKTLVALYRDNGGSSRVFRSVSTDNGRAWTAPVKTNFPNSTSKLFSLRTSTGDRILFSNANPAVGRRQLHMSISKDGLTFNGMSLLSIRSPRPSTLQYPHAIERDGRVLVAFSRNKNQIEVFSIPLVAIQRLGQMSVRPLP